MAGGKLTPRQKMINLMYLVFIAMLALNMSKEVLTAFGLMNEKFVAANTNQAEMNKSLSEALNQKASDDPTRYSVVKDRADKISKASNEFYNFLGKVKSDIEAGFEKEENGKLPYEAMDKSTIDESWFAGDGYSPEGKKIVDAFETYKRKVKDALGKDVAYQKKVKEIEEKFSTSDIKDGEGVKKNFLDYHFKGFPAIATVAKLTAFQNDVKNIEAGLYNIFMGNAMEQALSLDNFKAIVALDKNVYFEGEQVKGKVVIGKYDASTVPTAFEGPGKIENGQAVIETTAGGIGEHPVKGKFTFMENGKPKDLEFDGKYVVVPKPKSATVSADKMNVVYRGVPNPMTISFAGIPDSDVNASAPGLRKTGNGKYILSPGSGTSVTINVTGKLPTGNVSDKKVFRIKGIPSPTGKIRGEDAAKGPKSSLEKSQISAVLEDFDFPVDVIVKQFNIKVPGQPTIVNPGSRLNARAKAAVKKAMKGDVIIISDIKVEYKGIKQAAKKVSPCTFEII